MEIRGNQANGTVFITFFSRRLYGSIWLKCSAWRRLVTVNFAYCQYILRVLTPFITILHFTFYFLSLSVVCCLPLFEWAMVSHSFVHKLLLFETIKSEWWWWHCVNAIALAYFFTWLAFARTMRMFFHPMLHACRDHNISVDHCVCGLCVCSFLPFSVL